MKRKIGPSLSTSKCKMCLLLEYQTKVLETFGKSSGVYREAIEWLYQYLLKNNQSNFYRALENCCCDGHYEMLSLLVKSKASLKKEDDVKIVERINELSESDAILTIQFEETKKQLNIIRRRKAQELRRMKERLVKENTRNANGCFVKIQL